MEEYLSSTNKVKSDSKESYKTGRHQKKKLWLWITDHFLLHKFKFLLCQKIDCHMKEKQ